MIYVARKVATFKRGANEKLNIDNVDNFLDKINKRAEKNNALYSMDEICDIVDKIREKKTDDRLCCV